PLLTSPPPPSTLFPYTTLFRSNFNSPTFASSGATQLAVWSQSVQSSTSRDLVGRAVPNFDALAMPADATLLTYSGTPQANVHFRSEEHTSELQSRVDLVCRLLL